MFNIAPNLESEYPASRRSLWLLALVLGCAFFANEHNMRQSLKNDFTEDADEMVATAEGGNAIRRLAVMAIAAAGVAAICLASKTKLNAPTLLGVSIVAFLCVAYCSLLWTDSRGMCLRRLFVLTLCLVGGVGLARRLSLSEICLVALLVSGSLVAVGVGCEVLLGTFRPWSGEYRFSGTVHPNTQGTYLAVLIFSAFCLHVQTKTRSLGYLAIIAAAIGLLVLTKSRTSTAGVIATLGMLWLCTSSSRVRIAVPALCIGVAAVGLLTLLFSGGDADALLAKIAFMGREEETESFSGRTTIWPAVEYHIAKHFWLGYGYESFWTPSTIEDITAECEWPVREAHSAYREILLGLGAVGLGLYLLTVFTGMASSIRAFATSGNACALFAFGMALNGLFNGMFESGMAMICFPTFITALCFIRMALFGQRSTATAPTTYPLQTLVRPYA